jgi:hypothetical protein
MPRPLGSTARGYRPQERPRSHNLRFDPRARKAPRTIAPAMSGASTRRRRREIFSDRNDPLPAAPGRPNGASPGGTATIRTAELDRIIVVTFATPDLACDLVPTAPHSVHFESCGFSGQRIARTEHVGGDAVPFREADLLHLRRHDAAAAETGRSTRRRRRDRHGRPY